MPRPEWAGAHVAMDCYAVVSVPGTEGTRELPGPADPVDQHLPTRTRPNGREAGKTRILPHRRRPLSAPTDAF